LQETTFVFVPQALLRRITGGCFGHCRRSDVAVIEAYRIALSRRRYIG
jgi:hypothetical protein